MLIVNADDLGASPTVTRAIEECFGERLVSSTSAMVWMHGTSLAAARAREHGWPVGLHLNLTLPFDDLGAPADVRDRQLRLARLFTKDGWTHGCSPAGLDDALLRSALDDQLDRFHEQFGAPTHVDGHHHVHLHDAVLRLLPPGIPVRPRIGLPARGVNADQRDARMRASFTGPDASFAFEHLHPALGGRGLEVLDAARHGTVEVVVHPAQQADRDALRSPAWRGAVKRLTLGSYLDLA